jgi:hypothetical protein
MSGDGVDDGDDVDGVDDSVASVRGSDAGIGGPDARALACEMQLPFSRSDPVQLCVLPVSIGCRRCDAWQGQCSSGGPTASSMLRRPKSSRRRLEDSFEDEDARLGGDPPHEDEDARLGIELLASDSVVSPSVVQPPSSIVKPSEGVSSSPATGMTTGSMESQEPGKGVKI